MAVMLLVMVGAISFEPKRLGRAHRLWDPLIRSPVDRDDDETEGGGVRWAVLVAGSNGYGNYRHQVIFLTCRFYCRAKEK